MQDGSTSRARDQYAVLGLMLGVGLAVTTAQAAAPRPESGAAALPSAEAAGWELIFTDAFDRDAPGDKWQAVEGEWAVQDGALVGQGVLISAGGFPGPDPFRSLPGTPPPGFIRLEFDMRLEDAGKEQDVGIFIHVLEGNPLRSGYYFQLGGSADAMHMVRRMGTTLLEDQAAAGVLSADKTCRVVVENDEGVLRLIVDGVALLEHKETGSVIGDGYDRVGFNLPAKVRISNLRLYVKRLPDSYI